MSVSLNLSIFFLVFLAVPAMAANPGDLPRPSLPAVEAPPASAGDKNTAPLQITALQAGPPVRQGYGYRVEIKMTLKSSSKIPGFPVTFEYTTSAGRSYRCSNISLPSLYPREQETVYAAGMEPGEEQILSGYLLIPTGWYRGSGTLTAMAPYCTKKADGKNVCDGEPGEGHIDKHNSASIQLLLY